MNKISLPFLVCIICMMVLYSCSPKSQRGAGRDGWLKGDDHEKFELIATQFRGFDMAMVETGYRYQELYWAGQDMNWEYADYQTNKIKTAIERGLDRRPKRAANAKKFLSVSIPAMKQAIQAQDSVVFNNTFRMLTANCNNCHLQEGVPFFKVQQPTARQSPIQR